MLIWLGLVQFLISCLGLPKQCPYQCDKASTGLITQKKEIKKKADDREIGYDFSARSDRSSIARILAAEVYASANTWCSRRVVPG